MLLDIESNIDACRQSGHSDEDRDRQTHVDCAADVAQHLCGSQTMLDHVQQLACSSSGLYIRRRIWISLVLVQSGMLPIWCSASAHGFAGTGRR